MRYRRHAFILIALATLAGCQSVHTTQEGSVPVAMWTSLAIADQHGRPLEPDTRKIVSKVLCGQGLHPTLDEGGISVPQNEETRAREVLLTDKRLKGLGVIVLLAVPAGTGTRTTKGFEVPAVTPPEPMQFPTTMPSP